MDSQKILFETGIIKDSSRHISSEFLKKCKKEKMMKGNVIYKPGDKSDFIYVVIHGKVIIYTINNEGEEHALAEKKNHEYFGEDSILSLGAKIRNVTAKALEDTELLVVPASELKKELEYNPEIEKLIAAHGTDYVFKELEKSFSSIQRSKIDLSRIQSLGKTRKYIDREVIFFQNNEADYAYLILNGMIDLRSEALDEKDKIMATLEEGEIVGELGILNDEPRQAMAVARGDTELMLFDKETVVKLYREDLQFKNVIKALKRSYKMPHIGNVRRYEGVFLGMPAICMKVELSKDKTVVSYQIVGNDIFCISLLGIEDYESFSFAKSSKEKREIWIKDGVLVGVINYGFWDDNSDFAQMLLNETSISQKSIKHFLNTGTVLEKETLQAFGNILCQCMQVSYDTVNAAIRAGENTVDDIIKFTGAGSVCGCCKSNIEELLGSNAWRLYRLTKLIKHNDIIWSFRFTSINSGLKADFKAGQHATLKLRTEEGWIERPYTITSHPNDDYYEFTIKKEDKGALSSWLFDNAKVDMLIYLTDPKGDYTFDVPLQKPLIIFAGGIGITPAIVLAKSLGKNNKYPCYVDYSYRNLSDVICKDFFEQTMNDIPQFKINFRQTSVEGRITTEEIQKSVNALTDPDIYICGPPDFNKGIEETLIKDLRISSERISIEEFSHVGGPRRSNV